MGRSETVHGLRSSFSDWAHECTSFSNHAIELSLAHSPGNEVERAYRRGDMFHKRRKLMEAWAHHCLTPPAAQTGKVVSIAAGAAMTRKKQIAAASAAINPPPPSVKPGGTRSRTPSTA